MEVIHVVEGNSLLIYRFLYDAAHSTLDDTVSVYAGVQILLVLSEISQSASYPLCSSVFQLLHFCIGRLAPKLNKPVVLNDLNDFQNCLDLLQLVWKTGFGPYPTAAFSVVNKYNQHRNITPTAIAMFPLSILRNLTGLYLSPNTQFLSGTLLDGTSFAAEQRLKALREHLHGRVDLSATATKEERNVLGSVDRDDVFVEHKEKRRQLTRYEETEEEVKEEERRQRVHRKAIKRAAKLKYVRGVEKGFVMSFVKDADKLIGFHDEFSHSGGFSEVNVNGRFVNMYSLFVKVLEKGGFAEITDDDWRKVVLSLGFESCSEEIVRVMKGNYEVELFPFEKCSVLIATNTLQVAQYDIRQFDRPSQVFDTNLNYSLRCVRTLRGDEGFATSCIEGRVSIGYFAPNTSDRKPYCFKCHRQAVNGVDTVFSVDALVVHPERNCLVTGGGNHSVCFWDYKSKKRITQITVFEQPIAALAFNADGSRLAIASSYLYENGKKENTSNTIVVKTVTEKEVAK
ncbi:mitotic checkpoint protein [Blastocystis sp. ATCC 50177/Nand II]|uniref:Mitotic checkpoint protein n=1 Tax=Blastocystis sp. subtype 1 (strain ATCC 50177 / NandII) TaxID=478820 RepID=A0A196S3Q4_BLAHN|nr:mitotic checkpoint protein [Blastocystis sp. ATCC 50177/Nand II]